VTDGEMASDGLRVVVIGAGPAGVYAADALTKSDDGSVARVDVLDRLPAPFGLVRYGVAPDHVKMKSVEKALAGILQRPTVRFFGNVQLGRDISVAELRERYDAVVYASGAARDRKLGIPGEDLQGSFSATDFVAWYNGHPDASVESFTLQSHAVAVVGAGNVALDVARVLVRSAEELARTDCPDRALDVLRASAVRDVHVLIRRGPAQTKFTTKELRELGELDGVQVDLDAASVHEIEAEDPVAGRNLAVFVDWAGRTITDDPSLRTVHVHFLTRPVEVVGDADVSAVRVERTKLDESGNAVGTGEILEIPVQMVLRSVGYLGSPLPDVPFDERSGTVPNETGRVLREGVVAQGEFVTGWLRRGPTGIIGTNRSDATEVVAGLREELAAGRLPMASIRDDDSLPRLLATRGVTAVDWAGWTAIDAAEIALGESQGRTRAKLAEWEHLLAAAAGSDH
jgi:ferredoxin--NADP+ reductase